MTSSRVYSCSDEATCYHSTMGRCTHGGMITGGLIRKRVLWMGGVCSLSSESYWIIGVGLGRLGNIFTDSGSSDSPGMYIGLAVARPTGLLYFVITVLFPCSIFACFFPFYFILAVLMRRRWLTVCAWKREKRNKPKQQRKMASKKECCMKNVQWAWNKVVPSRLATAKGQLKTMFRDTPCFYCLRHEKKRRKNNMFIQIKNIW